MLHYWHNLCVALLKPESSVHIRSSGCKTRSEGSGAGSDHLVPSKFHLDARENEVLVTVIDLSGDLPVCRSEEINCYL